MPSPPGPSPRGEGGETLRKDGLTISARLRRELSRTLAKRVEKPAGRPPPLQIGEGAGGEVKNKHHEKIYSIFDYSSGAHDHEPGRAKPEQVNRGKSGAVFCWRSRES